MADEDEGGVADRGQRHEGDAVREVAGEVPGQPEGQPRLADPAGAGQGDEAHVVAAAAARRRRDLALAADQARQRGGQGRAELAPVR